jgi:hypothetical protein
MAIYILIMILAERKVKLALLAEEATLYAGPCCSKLLLKDSERLRASSQ